MNALVVMPVLVPAATAACCLIGWQSFRVQQRLAFGGSVVLLLCAVLLLRAVWNESLILQLGGWEAPFGISFTADLLSAIMVLMAAVAGVVATVYAAASVDIPRKSFFFFPLMQVLVMGVCGAFLTGDLFNLYVWFEVMLMSSFVLIALGGERKQLTGAVKYVTLNLMSSVIFLIATGLLFGKVGTLNFVDLGVKLADHPDTGLVTTISLLFLTAFGVKAAIFPLFFWLPASYHTPPFAVSAIFAALLTKVGIYSIIRVFTVVFPCDEGIRSLMLVAAGLSMIVGVLGAASQFEIRRILAFHSVSQIGYILMGFALGTPLAIGASIYFILHHSVVKSNLFLIAGLIERARGSNKLKDEPRIGMWRSAPMLSLLFFVTAMSLAGVPPLSGFFGKLALVKAGLAVDSYAIVAAALATGVMTMYSMTKIWGEGIWRGPQREPEPAVVAASTRQPIGMVWPAVFLLGMSVALGLGAGPVFRVCITAAERVIATRPATYAETHGLALTLRDEPRLVRSPITEVREDPAP